MSGDRVQFIPTTKIKVGDRTREDFGDMEGLVASVADKGLIQPITISADYRLLAGGRRYEACLRAGIKSIPCLIRDTKGDTIDALEVELIENIERKDFTWQEQARHIKKLQDHCTTKSISWSGRKLATLLDRSQKTVQRQLYLAEHLEQIPELANIGTQDDAEKAIKKMHEEVVTAELRRRQDTTQNKGLEFTLKAANNGYKVMDCFKGMAELPSNGVLNLIELDPPYAVDLVTIRKNKQGGTDDKTKEYAEIPIKEYKTFMDRMAKETYRVAGRHCWMICWFGNMNYHLVDTSLREAGWSVSDVPGIWAKPGGQTAAPEYNLANSYEPFFVCRKGQPTLVKRGRSNIFQYGLVPAGEKYHPTERPMDLMLELLATFCMPTNRVLIPCLGSGKTLRACYLAGMGAWGYDISGKYKDKFLLGVEADTKKLDEE